VLLFGSTLLPGGKLPKERGNKKNYQKEEKEKEKRVKFKGSISVIKPIVYEAPTLLGLDVS